MELTNEELSELDDLLMEELLYGDDELVHMTSEYGKQQNELLSSISGKVRDEAKRRKLNWA